MPRNYNSASRVYHILDVARKSNSSAAALHVWAQVFNIDEQQPNRRIIEISKMMGLLYDEVERAQEEMKATPISSEHYEPAFERIFRALDVQALGNQWSTYSQHIGPETLQLVGMCADLTPSDGIPLDDEELSELSEQLRDLRRDIEESDLPSDVKAFFFNHIELLLDAIRKYPIQGTEAFRRAAADAGILFRAGQAMMESNTKNEAFTRPMQQLLGAWGKIKEGTEHAGAAYLVYEAVRWVFDAVRPLLPG